MSNTFSLTGFSYVFHSRIGLGTSANTEVRRNVAEVMLSFSSELKTVKNICSKPIKRIEKTSEYHIRQYESAAKPAEYTELKKYLLDVVIDKVKYPAGSSDTSLLGKKLSYLEAFTLSHSKEGKKAVQGIREKLGLPPESPGNGYHLNK